MAFQEQVPPGEAEQNEAFAKRLAAVQAARAAKRPVGRALHYKPIAVARAELVVDEVPDGLRVGIFAQPGRYDAAVRYSNGSGGPLPDKEPDVRGMAVKVLGVPGPKLIPALRDATTQDFLAITNEVTPFRTTEEFVSTVEATSGPIWKAPFALAARLGLSATFRLLRDLQREFGSPLAHYVEKPFYSAAPVLWGAAPVKFAFVPTTSLDGPPIDRGPRDHYAPDLARRLRAGPLRLELRVQRWVDEATTPVEDGNVRWPTPWERVATLTLPAQDVESEEGRALAAKVDGWSFDPWHAPVEFRPVGIIMRARNAAYRESGKARGAAPEPTSL